MVETPLARQDVHEAEIEAVHRHRVRDDPQAAQAPELAESPAGLGLLEQHLERQPARHAQVAPPLLRYAGEVLGLLRDHDAAPLEDVGQLLERDRRVHVRPPSVRHTPAYTTGVPAPYSCFR